MSEGESTPTSPITPLDRMKQWVFDKLQKDISLDDPAYNYNVPKRESLSGPVPKIVISDATRSPRIPFARVNKPSPLKRTWVNYDLESPATNISPTGVIKSPIRSPNRSPKSFNRKVSSETTTSSTSGNSSPRSVEPSPRMWHKSHSPLLGQASPRANSLPVTPHTEKPKEFWSPNYKPDLESPLQKFAKRKTSASSLPLQSPAHWKRRTNYAESPTSSITSAEFAPPVTDLPPKTNVKCTSHTDVSPRGRRKAYDNKPLRLIGSQNDVRKNEVKSLTLNTNMAMPLSWTAKLAIPKDNEDECDSKQESEGTQNDENRRSTRRRRSSILSLICLDKDNSSGCSDRSDDDGSAEKQNVDETDDETVSRGTQYVEKLYKGVPIGGLASMFEMYKNSSEWGSVKVRFQYFNNSRRFQVSLIRAKNVGRGKEDKLQLYVKVCLMPGKIQKQTGQGYHETHNPTFYESFNFKRLKLGEIVEKRLKIKFYNKLGFLTKSESLGEVIIPLFNYDLTADTITWLHLRRCRGQKVGTIFVILITFYLIKACLYFYYGRHD